LERKKSIIYRQIGAKVAYQRMLHDMTQDELAERVHVSKSTIGRIERGRYNQGVSLSTIMDIADGLDIEMVQLLTFTEQEKNLQTAPVPTTKNGGGVKPFLLRRRALMRGVCLYSHQKGGVIEKKIYTFTLRFSDKCVKVLLHKTQTFSD